MIWSCLWFVFISVSDQQFEYDPKESMDMDWLPDSSIHINFVPGVCMILYCTKYIYSIYIYIYLFKFVYVYIHIYKFIYSIYIYIYICTYIFIYVAHLYSNYCCFFGILTAFSPGTKLVWMLSSGRQSISMDSFGSYSNCRSLTVYGLYMDYHLVICYIAIENGQ